MSWPVELTVVPVVTVASVDQALHTAEQLAADGLRVLEVTLRTSAALQAISAVRRELPDVFCGAGTLRSPADVSAAVEAGAQFLVSPGSTDALLDAMLDSQVLALPGAATPSEAMRLLDRGITVAKFFPAEASGGVAALRTLAGPLPMQWCATGGITAATASEYLALPNVVAVGGSWMVPA
jgi:2-dehydro-3-deoxyphosphogluconate aldolase/(4S)-4-hydroxy-2-oxoglutarate aldolase